MEVYCREQPKEPCLPVKSKALVDYAWVYGAGK